MTDTQRRAAAKQFAADWQGKGYEKGHSQTFWLSLLQKVYGVEEPDKFITFEDQIMLDHTSFIDGFIPSPHVLIEQKSLGKELNKPIKQSDGSLLSPFQQAKRYAAELPYSQRPRWIVTCNFAEFYVYDMERPTGEPEIIRLCDLEKEYYRLQFLVDTGDTNIKKEMEVSLQAGELVGKLYNAILKQYKNPDNPESLKSLNMLCVRLVFCLYAEDAGIFGRHNMFHDYLQQFELQNVRKGLIELFKILDTKDCDRDPYDESPVSKFPYVNGGLFADENIEIPNFDEEIVALLLNNASMDFDWSAISPTIFGAVFESTLNPETRRSGGMHYTSIENIHKVIDPLFLDDLKKELEEIKAYKQTKTRNAKLLEFQDKLSSLKFLDPACGSGNFLTETYISLRRLENEAIKMRQKDGQIEFDLGEIIKVSIGQFYGIEINDFAVSVAKTALWIAESQMMHETEEIVHMNLDFLPLKSYANIVEGNALRIDWESVVPKNEVDFIMGNPPFVGGMYMSDVQKAEIRNIFDDVKGVGEFDYVCAWYKKAADYIADNNIFVAFVSTNSICQGEQVTTFWKHLIEKYKIHIDFAHTTFVWNNESTEQAKVHCVIVGFSKTYSKKNKYIFDNGNQSKICSNISPYLTDTPNFFIEARSTPLCNVPHMKFGSMPRDGGGFVLSAEERKVFIEKEPLSEKWIRPYVGAAEFLNNKERYCLWLVGAEPGELAKCKMVKERIDNVRQFRAASKAASTRKFADTPTLFCQIAQPDSYYLIIPRHSSKNRRYIPFGFVEPNVICGDANLLLPNATLYHCGVVISNVHNAWMRQVAGPIKSDYRYSKDIVYNCFPWCSPTDEQKAKIEQTAKSILDARALYPNSTLSNLYDESLMPKELRKAHQNNDRAVMQAYGFDVKTMTESECVAELMKMYQGMTGGK